MRWDAVELARFARAGRFVGDDVTTAVAVALVTSGGIASYDMRAGVPGAGHWVGLWGVNVDRYPDMAGRDLCVPHVAARAAHELCTAAGGWGWSPPFTSGRYLPFVAHAGEARTREYDHQHPERPYTFHTTANRIGDALATLTDVRRTLANTHRLWS